MNRKSLIMLTIIIFSITLLMMLKMCKDSKNKLHIKETELINIAENIINTDTNSKIAIITNEELKLSNDVIGIIEIPKLNTKAPVREGTTQNILKYAVGHFSNSSQWNGNIALASHNQGNYVAHYFENINKLEMGDEIIYRTKFGERRYEVVINKEIVSTDWSVISKTKENIITLITCVKNEPKFRICVQAAEK